jgi:hypothetical protein
MGLCQRTVSEDSRCSESLFTALQYLVLAISRKAGNWPFSVRIGVRLCRIVDMNF